MKKLWPLVLVPVALLGLWQRQYIYDQIRLHNYTPTAQVQQLATDTTMTPSARRVFYVNHPLRADRSVFSGYCSSNAEQTAVLGCYKAPQNGIYLLTVSNSELAGIEQVTAAHEMLHAEYDRLSSKERSRINTLLQNYYDNGLTDAETKKTIDGYRKTEPNDVVNEMHSILGTQIVTLPPALESYYSRYFTDRQKVARYYQSYEQAFTSRRDQIKQFDSQLKADKQTIDDLESQTDQQSNALEAQRAELESQRSSGNYQAYNNGVTSYNAAVNSYNANVRRLRSIIDSYNQLVKKRNAIAFEEQNLVNAISAPKLKEQK